MRFYVKLILVLGTFAWLCSSTTRRMLDNLAFEARVGFVYAFGTAADRERLIEYTLRWRAVRCGYLKEYLEQELLLQSIEVFERSAEDRVVDEQEPVVLSTPDADRGSATSSRKSPDEAGSSWGSEATLFEMLQATHAAPTPLCCESAQPRVPG